MPDIVINPVRLPRATPDAVRLFNALSLRGRTIVLPLAAGRLAASLGYPPSLAASEPEDFCTAVIRASVDGSPWTVRLDERGASLLLSHPVFDDPALSELRLESLPEALASAAAAALLAPAAQKLSQALGAEVKILGFARRPAGAKLRPAALAVALAPEGLPKMGKAPFPATVSAPPEAVERLASKLAALPRRAEGMLAGAADGIPMDISFVAGRVRLTAEDFDALALGDVILPDEWLLTSGQLDAVLLSAERTMAHALCQRKTAAGEENSENEAHGADQLELALAEAWRLPEENDMQTTDELTVELAFELERRRLTVGELKSLEPGYVFRLSADPATPVTVLANGRPVARGRLVDVNGALGVELQEALGGPERGAAHDN